MSEPLACCACGSPLLMPGDEFCCRCGCAAGSVVWSLSADRGPGAESVTIRPGQPFYVVARNTGIAAVRIQVDGARVRGARLLGSATGSATPSQPAAFAFEPLPGETPKGLLLLRSRDGARREWWERSTWRDATLPLTGKVRVAVDRWVLGSPTVLFTPGLKAQNVRIWNDAVEERTFDSEVPVGFRILAWGNDIDRRPLRLRAGLTELLRVELVAQGPKADVDDEWRAGPVGEPVPIVRMPVAAWNAGVDAVVAVDFGTRNTGVRVRWRRQLAAGKPAGTVDIVGDQAENARFPTAMVIHRKESSFLWGTEAAVHIERNLLREGEVEVRDLKTHLRLDTHPFVSQNPRWTNEELLAWYFQGIFDRLDQYFRTADPAAPLDRRRLRIRYVLTRPVLDANEGDAGGARYEKALKVALARCDVPEDRIDFLFEPEAAAIGIARRRDKELLELEDEIIGVVDAGGGTTDVSLAVVRLREGTVALEVLGSYDLRLATHNPALRAVVRFGSQDVQVGGNLLDYALAERLMTSASDVLETDSRPIPSSILVSTGREEADPALRGRHEREFLANCRLMKERFVSSSSQYLNRERGKPGPPGEVLPFPNRPEYEGIFLAHDLFNSAILEPVLNPVAEELSERISTLLNSGPAIRRIRRVFYVGGTNIDGFVRRRFRGIFPGAPAEQESSAPLADQIQERLSAVVDGAIWRDEGLYAASPVTLTLVMHGTELAVVQAGAPLLPAGLATVLSSTALLEPGEELDAQLLAETGPTAGRICIARGFHRNATDAPREVTLQVAISREKGAVGTLIVGNYREDQWQVALVDAGK